jgi:hypothetical protein
MLLENGKKKCDCGKIAVFVYMPGYGDGGNNYVCDDCISSQEYVGCSCNWRYGLPQEGLPIDEPEGVEGKDWRWVIKEADEYEDAITMEDGYWQYLDERGRPYPCVEYEYDKEGFPKYTWLGRKVSDISWEWYIFRQKAKRKLKAWWKNHVVQEIPDELNDLF